MEKVKPFYVLFGSKNQIEYKGRTINKYVKLTEPGEYVLRFTIIKNNSPFHQAIVLFFNDFQGEYYLNGAKRPLPKGAFPKENFWTDTMPQTTEVALRIRKGNVVICNGSDPLGTKQICHSLVWGCAIFLEKIGENSFRFNCNDHEIDDDFDDLIFEMEIIKPHSYPRKS